MRRALVLLPAAAVLILPTTAGATWSASASGSATISARSMVNATGLTALCATAGKPTNVTLTWTRSTDSLVTGYDVVRTGSDGTTATTPVAGAATVTLTDSPPVVNGVSYTYAIRSTSSTVVWRTPLLASAGGVSFDTKGKCVNG